MFGHNELKLLLARTLWENTYRGKITDATGAYLATVRIIPCLPLERSEVPPDAPHVLPYLTVLVEDALLEEHELITFETSLTELLLARFQTQTLRPEYCRFFYPSPASISQGLLLFNSQNLICSCSKHH